MTSHEAYSLSTNFDKFVANLKDHAKDNCEMKSKIDYESTKFKLKMGLISDEEALHNFRLLPYDLGECEIDDLEAKRHEKIYNHILRLENKIDAFMHMYTVVPKS